MIGAGGERTRVLLSSILGLIVWGLWGYYANRHSETPALAGLAQGGSSFVLTLTFTSLVELLYRKLPRPYSTWAPFLPFTITTPVIIGLHLSLQTENILITILPPFLVSIAYMSIYRRALIKEVRPTKSAL